MKKFLVPLTATVVALSAFSATAKEDKSHCYPMMHSSSGLGSFKTAVLPFVINKRGRWNPYINIVNISEEFINVKVKVRDAKGVLLKPKAYTIKGDFMSNTDPFSYQTGGGILRPNYSAELALNETFRDNFTIELTWQANACIPKALSTMLRVRYQSGGEFDEVVNQFNGGVF